MHVSMDAWMDADAVYIWGHRYLGPQEALLNPES